MLLENKQKLYKAYGVLWEVYVNNNGSQWLNETPLCPNESCHTPLDRKNKGWFCVKCEKNYPCKTDYYTAHRNAEKMWRGYKTLDWTVYSLELPPTKVVGKDEDENYWIRAKIGEKEGKRMAVVFFGEKIKGKQDKTDYSHLFIDLEDEQLRFDKGNKNPMGILCKLTAEFKDSIVKQEKK